MARSPDGGAPGTGSADRRLSHEPHDPAFQPCPVLEDPGRRLIILVDDEDRENEATSCASRSWSRRRS